MNEKRPFLSYEWPLVIYPRPRLDPSYARLVLSNFGHVVNATFSWVQPTELSWKACLASWNSHCQHDFEQQHWERGSETNAFNISEKLARRHHSTVVAYGEASPLSYEHAWRRCIRCICWPTLSHAVFTRGTLWHFLSGPFMMPN